MAQEQTSLLYINKHVHAFWLALASPQTSFGVRSRGRNECVTNEPQRTSAGRLDWLLLLMERVSLWCTRFRDSFEYRRHFSDKWVTWYLVHFPKYQSDQILLVMIMMISVYWWAENYFSLDLLQFRHESALDGKSPKQHCQSKRTISSYSATYLINLLVHFYPTRIW